MLAFREESGITPLALLNKPKLSELEHWVYDCFVELSRDRRYTSTSPLAITTPEIYEYCQIYEIDSDSFYYLCRMIKAIDDKWRDRVTEKQKKQSTGVTQTPAKS